jgi:hypothetical protein
MKKRFSIVLILLFLSIAARSAVISDAKIEVISSTPSETVLEIRFPYPEFGAADGSISMGTLEGFQKPGYPLVPYVSGLIAIGGSGGFSAVVQSIDEYSHPFPGFSEQEYDCYPGERLMLDTPQILRDFRVVRFQFHPVQYEAAGTVRIARSAVIRIFRTSSTGENELRIERNRVSAAFHKLYKSCILNYPLFDRFIADTILYVIITPDTYYDYLLDFKEAKEKFGLIVMLVKFSDISPGPPPSHADIRNYLHNAYTAWEHPPDYFLAVGDAGVFPVKYTTDYASGGTYADDNYYVALDSTNDILPDIFGGRLPIQNSFHIETILNRIINYEHTPYMAETTWYNRAIMIASDEYPSQPETKVWIRNRFMDYGYELVDSIYARNFYSAAAMKSQIAGAVNAGRGFLNYRGPGWSGGWSTSMGYCFSTPDVAGLNNGRKLPVATSLGCGVAKFDESTCFAEQWMRIGTPTAEKGAVSFFGATWITHTRHNNKMDKGIYKGFLQEGLTSFGEAAVRGKMYMYEITGISDTTVTEMNEYLILGDPSLLARTRVPKTMIVSHDTIVPIGESMLWVLVRDVAGPVADAFVCARMDSVFHVSGHTDSTGAVGLMIFPTTVDTILISAVHHNHFPYEGFCMVTAEGPWPGYLHHTIDDDTIGTSNGNDDAIPNLGETIELPVMLKNYGSEEVVDVSAVISSDDSYIAIGDSSEWFGTIPAGDSLLSQDDFDFDIFTNAPDGHTVLFEMVVKDGIDSTWVSHFKIAISSPELELEHFTIDDAGQPNPNGIIDPGETVLLTCRLFNGGSADAEAVEATLRSENVYVSCIDSTSTYGDIPSYTEKEGEPFTVEADAQTPVGFEASMKLIYTSARGYRDSSEICLKVGVGGDFLVWDPDENQTSGPKIKQALLDAGYRGEYSTALSPYLDILPAFKAVFICLGVYPNNYVLSNGYMVDSLCAFLNRGGRIYMEGADTWAYDQQTDLHAYFFINGVQDGQADTYGCNGINETFTQQMSFTYTGENAWMDHLGVLGSSFEIFKNSSPSYVNGVAYDAGTYQTVGTSFEFGGLVDGSPPSTKQALADSIMRFFSITPVHESPSKESYPVRFALQQNYPNPFCDRTTFQYAVPLRKGESPLIRKSIEIGVFDATGRRIRTLSRGSRSPGVYQTVWDGKDGFGKRVSQGVYFIRIVLEEEGLWKTKKAILLR